MISPREARALRDVCKDTPSRTGEFLRERVDQNTYAEVKAERGQRRIDDQPAERKSNRWTCGRCHCCRTRNQFGCSRNADQSMIDAVMVMGE